MQVENCVQSKVCMGVLGSQGDRKEREERKTAEEKHWQEIFDPT